MCEGEVAALVAWAWVFQGFTAAALGTLASPARHCPVPVLPPAQGTCHDGQVDDWAALKGRAAPGILPAALCRLEVLLAGLLPQHARQLIAMLPHVGGEGGQGGGVVVGLAVVQAWAGRRGSRRGGMWCASGAARRVMYGLRWRDGETYKWAWPASVASGTEEGVLHGCPHLLHIRGSKSGWLLCGGIVHVHLYRAVHWLYSPAAITWPAHQS